MLNIILLVTDVKESAQTENLNQETLTFIRNMFKIPQQDI